ncbi:MAG: hypothetical protein H0U70_00235 [Tatlockia sp.]|nr:hypothetical protein [Tatlockia sp.]
MSSSKTAIIYFLALISFSVSGLAEPTSQPESYAARIRMLEQALMPNSAGAMANLFAKANKERNGALQYLLFSDQLKSKYKDSWPNWVSGTSSPWITSYTIKKIAETKNKWQFLISYQWATAAGPFYPPLVQQITIESIPETANSAAKLWITQFDEVKN